MLEIHSRKSQGHRNKVSEHFRNGRGLVMFTSDVSARGMDYPDVTAVMQVNKDSFFCFFGVCFGFFGGRGFYGFFGFFFFFFAFCFVLFSSGEFSFFSFFLPTVCLI